MKVKIVFPNKAGLSMGDQSTPDKLLIGLGTDANGNPIKMPEGNQATSQGAELKIMPMVDEDNTDIRVLEFLSMIVLAVGYIVIVGHVILNYVYNIPNYVLYDFINCLSNFAYITLVSVNHPGQVSVLSKKLIRIVTLDLISFHWINEEVVPMWDFKMVALPPDREKYVKLGFTDRNIMTVMGFTFIVFLVGVIIQVVA